jgi:drug/metabolite transporter (DMT)-like permease
MIIFGKKTIHYWKFWRTKSKLLFCLTSGIVYSVFSFVFTVITKEIIGKSENIIETSLYVALGAFVAASFMSIALWYENEKRFKLWIEENNP